MSHLFCIFISEFFRILNKGLINSILIGCILIVNLIVAALFVTKDFNLLDKIVLNDGKRKNDVYKEDFKPDASKAEFIIDNGEIVFRYFKSPDRDPAFSAVYFPIDELDIDFGSYDNIKFELTTDQAKRIPVNLSPGKKIKTYYFKTQYLEVTKGTSEYSLDIEGFNTPPSWFIENNITQTEVEKDLASNYHTISISSCHLLEKGVWDELTIHKIILSKDYKAEVIVLGLIAFTCLIGLWLVSKDYFSQSSEVIHLPIQHVEVDSKESNVDVIKDFIAKAYQNPDLKLKDVQFELGLGQSEVSKIFKNEFKMSFPQYLSFIRVEAAKTLLKESPELSISEVGYQVGFNSLSNFTRVFKSFENCPPKVYREL